MKKLITVSLILFLLTGCGKTIICKTKEGNVEEEYNIKYSGNDITKLSIKKTYKFDDVESFENFENTINYTVLSLKQPIEMKTEQSESEFPNIKMTAFFCSSEEVTRPMHCH